MSALRAARQQFLKRRTVASPRPGRAAAALTSIAAVLAVAAPAGAATGWSTPVRLSVPIPPTDVVEGAAAAADPAGAEAVGWDDQAADGTQFVHVRTSPDGVTWSPPTTFGKGIAPRLMMAPDGRTVAVWAGLLTPTTEVVQASVKPPGGVWGPVVTVGTDPGEPRLGMDAAGDAIASWASPGTGGIEYAVLPAGGSWSAVRQLATGGSGVDLAVNAAGSAVVSWTGPSWSIVAASGSLLGGFAAPVTVATPSYRQHDVHVGLNGSGAAVLAWRGRTTDLASTRTPAGLWAAPTLIGGDVAGAASGSVDAAIDGAGNAVAVVYRLAGTSGAGGGLYLLRKPAAGSWATATPVPGGGGGAQLVADEAGSFVLAFNGNGGLTAVNLTAGGALGPAVVVGQGGGFDLHLVPGQAILGWTGGGAMVSHQSLP